MAAQRHYLPVSHGVTLSCAEKKKKKKNVFRDKDNAFSNFTDQ